MSEEWVNNIIERYFIYDIDLMYIGAERKIKERIYQKMNSINFENERIRILENRTIRLKRDKDKLKEQVKELKYKFRKEGYTIKNR